MNKSEFRQNGLFVVTWGDPKEIHIVLQSDRMGEQEVIVPWGEANDFSDALEQIVGVIRGWVG